MAPLWRGLTLRLALRVRQGPENVLILQNAHFREFLLPRIQPVIDQSQKHSLFELLRNLSFNICKNSVFLYFGQLKKILFCGCIRLGTCKNLILIRKTENNQCVWLTLCAITIRRLEKRLR